MARLLDIIFFIFFLTHIPITLFIDLQGIIPAKFYPRQLVAVKEWHCATFKDNLMQQPPVWFQAIILGEFLFQTPFFFVAAYGYFKGARKCQWLRIPVIVYGTHVATTLIPILAHFLFADFSVGKQLGPKTLKERATLASIYLPYLLVPICLVLDAVFSSAYTTKQPISTKSSPKKSKKAKAN